MKLNTLHPAGASKADVSLLVLNKGKKHLGFFHMPCFPSLELSSILEGCRIRPQGWAGLQLHSYYFVWGVFCLVLQKLGLRKFHQWWWLQPSVRSHYGIGVSVPVQTSLGKGFHQTSFTRDNTWEKRQWPLNVAGLSCLVEIGANSTHRSSCVIFHRLSRVGRDRGYASLSILHSDVVTVATGTIVTTQCFFFRGSRRILCWVLYCWIQKSRRLTFIKILSFFRNKMNNNFLILLRQVQKKVLCTSKTFDLGMLFCLLDSCWAST